MTIKNRSRICLIISAAIIAIALLLTAIGSGINLGIDFAGGLSMQYRLTEKTRIFTFLTATTMWNLTATSIIRDFQSII